VPKFGCVNDFHDFRACVVARGEMAKMEIKMERVSRVMPPLIRDILCLLENDFFMDSLRMYASR
jgi:hypothetical protein